MSYLERRVRYLLDQLRAGRLILPASPESDDLKQAIQDLRAVRQRPDGHIDLSSCSDRVRSLARMFYMLRGLPEGPEHVAAPPPSPEPIHDILTRQRELFALFDEFFRRATGLPPEKFAELGHFDEAVRRHAESTSRRGPEAFRWFEENIHRFYKDNMTLGYSAAKQLGGLKLVLAGQRFPTSALAAIRKLLLYADTILIPDPVLPWFERDRAEEAFKLVHPLEATFTLLHLKPLIDADLPVPAILVFPSWEKTMELEDEQTKDGLGSLFLDFFSFHLGVRFWDESEVYEYARKNEARLLRTVEHRRLFFAPNGTGRESLAEGLALYKEMIKVWRSPFYQEAASRMSDAELLVQGIQERLLPQYHLRENADTLNAHPMMWLSGQWHYHTLCAKMSEESLKDVALLRPETIATLRALEEPRLNWLGNVPLHALVELRRANENESFRRSLCRFTDELNQASLEDLDRVAAEVGRGIASLFAEHSAQVERLDAEFRGRFGLTAAVGLVTLAAALTPWLAPFIGPMTPATLAALYGRDKIEFVRRRREATRSLAGVLAATNEESGAS